MFLDGNIFFSNLSKHRRIKKILKWVGSLVAKISFLIENKEGKGSAYTHGIQEGSLIMKFSVLLPTRNRLDLLSRAIETVRRQDYDNWEIIVSDNFSEENIASYIQLLGDSRIKYFRTDCFIPVTDNWNNALNNSMGDYIIVCWVMMIV